MKVLTTSGERDLEFVKLDSSLEIVFLGDGKVRVLWNVQKFPRICNELLDRGIKVKFPKNGDSWSGFGRGAASETFVSRTERAWETELIGPFPSKLLGGI